MGSRRDLCAAALRFAGIRSRRFSWSWGPGLEFLRLSPRKVTETSEHNMEIVRGC